MNAILTSKRTPGPIGGKYPLSARLWPNGEIAIWKPKTYKADPIKPYVRSHSTDVRMTWLRLQCEALILARALAPLLGLSILSNFDKSEAELIVGRKRIKKTTIKYGNSGITAYGKRMVRNAAHVIEKSAAKGRSIFATVTVPPLPIEKMAIIHQNWAKVVELYRLNLRRALQNQGLSGKIVTVTEIQEERYKKSGLPVSHLHSVFVGVTAAGKFAVSIKAHDRMWHAALSSVVQIERADCSKACNLQRVKKSASSYLGKYLSKGTDVVGRAIADGFESWLPKQWWNATRELVREVKSQTRRCDVFANWLNDAADESSLDIWKWHRDVVLESDDGHKITIARYGQLSERQTAEIQAYYLRHLAW